MNPFTELREITESAMQMAEKNTSPVEVLDVITTGCDRAIALAKSGAIAQNEELVSACGDVCDFLKDLARAYEHKTYSEILSAIGRP